jgi:hypothetical protein
MTHTKLGPEVYSASSRNEYQRQEMFLGSRERLTREFDNLTALIRCPDSVES